MQLVRPVRIRPRRCASGTSSTPAAGSAGCTCPPSRARGPPPGDVAVPGQDGIDGHHATVTRPATVPGREGECEDVMSFDQVRADWTRLGAEDPLWAVLVDPDKRGGRWDAEEFLAVGRRDVEAHRQWLARLGLPTTWSTALDFGCGAGRLTQALAAHADEVIGVDVSAPMLA